MSGLVYPEIVRLLQESIPPQSVVLDVGCGAKLYRPYLPVARYIGLDTPDSPYVEEKPEIVGYADSIPLAEQSVDVVFGIHTFFYHPDPVRSFRECRRILRNHGSLVVFDYDQRLLLQRQTENPQMRITAWDEPKLMDLLVQAGFARERVSSLSHRLDYLDYPDPARLAFRTLRRRMGRSASNWIVMAATR